MSIKGKTESISRYVGSSLIFISIVLEIYLSFMILTNYLLSVFLILSIIPPFIFSILLKIEQEFIVKNAKGFLFLLLLEMIVLNFIILTYYSISLALTTVLFSISIILLIISWHFSLSIYKKKKIIFIMSGTSYYFVYLPILLDSILFTHLLINNLILLFLFFLGVFLIILAELLMRKKGWLNYV